MGGEAPAWRVLLSFGTVLSEGEALTDERVIGAAGHRMAATYHILYESGNVGALDALPGGIEWRKEIERFPERERHLWTHEQHLVGLTGRDRRGLDAGGAQHISVVSLTGTVQQLRERLVRIEAAGVTEIAYQPAGPDIPGELERMASALR